MDFHVAECAKAVEQRVRHGLHDLFEPLTLHSIDQFLALWPDGNRERNAIDDKGITGLLCRRNLVISPNAETVKLFLNKLSKVLPGFDSVVFDGRSIHKLKAHFIVFEPVSRLRFACPNLLSDQ